MTHTKTVFIDWTSRVKFSLGTGFQTSTKCNHFTLVCFLILRSSCDSFCLYVHEMLPSWMETGKKYLGFHICVDVKKNEHRKPIFVAREVWPLLTSEIKNYLTSPSLCYSVGIYIQSGSWNKAFLYKSPKLACHKNPKGPRTCSKIIFQNLIYLNFKHLGLTLYSLILSFNQYLVFMENSSKLMKENIYH